MTTTTSTETITSSSTTPRRAARPATTAAPTHAPDQHSTTGAWILSVVCLLMAITIGASFFVASSIDY